MRSPWFARPIGWRSWPRDWAAREQARATRLLDEVADLNREKIEIAVTLDVVAIAGLAA